MKGKQLFNIERGQLKLEKLTFTKNRSIAISGAVVITEGSAVRELPLDGLDLKKVIHPDFEAQFNRLKEHILTLSEYKTTKPEKDKIAVKSITVTGEGMSYGAKLVGTRKTKYGPLPLTPGRVVFKQKTYAKASELEEIWDNLTEELWEYMQEGKAAQLEAEFGDEEPRGKITALTDENASKMSLAV